MIRATTENQTTTESQTSDDVTMEEENSLSGFAATLAGKAVKEDGTPYKVALMYSDLRIRVHHLSVGIYENS